jgi:3-hydroxyisobutyrate dehydrogenase-like beta-hydroxyacid dehydrogenase
MKLGFLGLGSMGAAIASNLARASHELAVWNRSPDKTRALVAMGATAAASPSDAARGKEIVFTMLSDDAALACSAGRRARDCSRGSMPGAIHVSMSTIGVATADDSRGEHARAAARDSSARRCSVVPTPPPPPSYVRGRRRQRGRAAAYARAARASVSQRLFEIGENPSSANLLKLCGNFMILAAIESLGESMALAARGGIAKRQLLDVLTATLFDAPVYRNYGAILVEERFRPAGFAASLGLKDMDLVAAAADAQRRDAGSRRAAGTPAPRRSHRRRAISTGPVSQRRSRRIAIRVSRERFIRDP